MHVDMAISLIRCGNDWVSVCVYGGGGGGGGCDQDLLHVNVCGLIAA